MLGNYAERVRFVRSLTKLSREAFESKYGINKNTLKSWELGINSLTEKSAIQIADAIKNEGFSCSPEWLIFGMGPEPRSFNSADSLLTTISEQSKIIYEAEYFKKNNENSFVAMITDTSMFPNYEIGDYVGGILDDDIRAIEKLKKFFGKICIIYLIKEIFVIRKIIRGANNIILLCPINNDFETEIIAINDIRALASIIWHRSSFIKL
ncbi:MAG TPA: hypothetical protein VLI69_00600 [Gammaproteobacteria bacterium]|nr:hypothetical protein [Gammaproteobacteria bacterium]